MGSIGMTSRKLIAIVTAMPIPTYAATTAPWSTTRVTTAADRDGDGGEGAYRRRPKRRAPGYTRAVAELRLDPQQPVVLGDALGARRRAGLDLAGAGGDGEVGDGRVLGLAACGG